MDNLTGQVGSGNHYTRWAYQPLKFVLDLRLVHPLACAVKYVMRYDDKNGFEDLAKAVHYLEVYAEHVETYGDDDNYIESDLDRHAVRTFLTKNGLDSCVRGMAVRALARYRINDAIEHIEMLMFNHYRSKFNAYKKQKNG